MNSVLLGDYVAKMGENGLDFHSEGSAWPKVELVAEKHAFFHWDLEFPGVFYGADGRRKGNPGFDAVVGNPPYGADLTKAEQKYYKGVNPESGSTDTAQLMVFAASKLLAKFGANGFIVPKALVFASNWKKTRERLLDSLGILIDCRKVWDKVKLEQVVYICNSDQMQSYITGTRTNNILTSDTKIDKKMYKEFGFFPCGLKHDEMLLGQKIWKKSNMLSTYAHNSRGGMLQNRIKEKGGNKIIGGAQIRRYYMSKDVKGYLDDRDINDCARVKKDSILAQRIVAHIANPVDHLKITATIPSETNFLILDTINQIMVNKVSPYYVLGLINSKIINWYAYRFIFAKAIRTMQFDTPTTNRLPIIINNENTVIKKVKKLIKMHSENQHAGHRNAEKTKNQLNCLFYKIFELTHDEIRMIEDATPE